MRTELAGTLALLVVAGAGCTGKDQHSARTYVSEGIISRRERVESRFRERTRSAPPVGEIRRIEQGQDEFMLEGKRVFAGYGIESVSVAGNGALALLCRSGPEVPFEKADVARDSSSGVLKASLGQVWIVRSEGPERISPEGMTASNALISPDGSMVAFAAVALNDRNLPVWGLELCFRDVAGRRLLRTLVVDDLLGYIYPLEWDEGGRAVWVYVDEGESPRGVRLELVRPLFRDRE